MHNKKKISILGCGWLGFELAQKLTKSGFKVKGSTTSFEKLLVLKSSDIDPYIVHFSENQIPDLRDFLDSDVLIITIPPGRKSPDGNRNYRLMANFLCGELPETNIQKVILISSTSVYGDQNKRLTEADEPLPDSPTGKLLIDVEKQFMQLNEKDIIVVRPGGLIGEDRYPGKFFSGKRDIENGLTPVNLIHKADISGIIYELVFAENASGIYNAVAPNHPTKKEFYTLAAIYAGLNPGNFVEEKVSWKIVESIRIFEELNYQFVYPDLENWLKGIRF